VPTGTVMVAGIGELVVSTNTSEVLVTYSLGSCLGVTVYDHDACVGGIIHCMLPLAKTEKDKPNFVAGRYVDTGIVLLLEKVMALGATKRGLVIKVAGAGSPMNQCERFQIGERNYAVLRKILWKNDLLIAGENIGGSNPKTMSLYMDSGRATVRTGSEETDL